MGEPAISFPVDHQLNGDLQYGQFEGPSMLRRTNAKFSTLPGQPRIRLDQAELQKYLRSELLLPELDRLAPKLWLVCLPTIVKV